MGISLFRNKKNQEERFWFWFSSKFNQYFGDLEKNAENIFPLLDNELHKIDTNLTYQFSAIKDNGKREFVISADGLKESIPSVLRLVNSAPNFDKWEVIAFRQPKQELTTIKMGEFEVSPDDIYFKEEYINKKLNLTLFVKNYTESKEYMGALFIILDSVLGEYDAMTQIDSLEVNILDEKNMENLKPLKDLPKLIDSKRNFVN